MNKTSTTGLVLTAALVGLISACSSEQSSPAPAGSEPTSTSSSVTSTTSEPQPIDVDPADYSFAADRYRFKLDGSPVRECAIYPATGTTVECSVTWPEGTNADPVQGSPFVGAPNTIVLAPDGYYPIIGEGGPPGAALLPVNSRISVDGVSCTAVPGGVECVNAVGGFSFVDGVLETSGPRSARTVVATTTTAAPPAPGGTDGVYTEGTTPARPGTVCGAATGRPVVVEVRSGSISCTDALAVVDQYNALPQTGEFGNANIREFDGWTCASRSAAVAAEKGYGQTCSNGDVEVATPYVPR